MRWAVDPRGRIVAAFVRTGMTYREAAALFTIAEVTLAPSRMEPSTSWS